MKRVNIAVRIILYLTLIASAVASYLGYSFSQDILKYVGYGCTALNLICIIFIEVKNAVASKKANGENFGLVDFLQIVYNCLPIVVGYAETIDQVSGGAIKGQDKENAAIEQLKLICEKEKVTFYEEQARAIIKPIIESDKIIQKVKEGTLTFAEISQMITDLKSTGGTSEEKTPIKIEEKAVEDAYNSTTDGDIDNTLLTNTLETANARLQQALDGVQVDNKVE
jgi:hypothetical protein